MKKTILLGALLAAGVVSAFPFRTSCGKVVQVSQTIANYMTSSQLNGYLTEINGQNCPQHAGAAVITVIYSHN